jgi:hypothetical protein
MNIVLSDEASRCLETALVRGGSDVTVDDVVNAALILLLRVNNLEVDEVMPLFNTTPGRGMRGLRMVVLSD